MQKRGRTKKGLSIMIGYVLLISFAVVMGGVIYTWMKSFADPTETYECPDGVSLYIKKINCTNLGGNNYKLDLTVINNGLFGVQGYSIKSTTSENQTLATGNISTGLNKTEGYGNRTTVQGSNLIFVGTTENFFNPQTEISNSFNFVNKIYSIEIIPLRSQEEDGRKVSVLCQNAKIKNEIIC